MDIRQLEVFVKVFETNSFSRAAEELGISQPTVSTHIQNLEDALGKKLFDRLGRRIVPTEEARILYRHAVEILKKREEALAELFSSSKKVSGTVKIATSNIPGDYLVPRILGKLRELLPQTLFYVDILDSNKVVNAMRTSVPKYDLGLVGIFPLDDRFEVKELAGDEIVLVAPPSYKREEIDIKELKELPLLFREEDSGTRRTVEEALKGVDLYPTDLKIVAYLGSNTAIKEAVKSGAGFGLVSKYSIEEEVKINLLKVVKVKGLEIKRKFFAIRRKDLTPSKAVKSLWESLGELVKSYLPQ